MSSTKLIKGRIKSSQNIAQITKAMEMVSASKMKRAQQMALASRPYTDKMYQVITSLSQIAQHQIDHFLLTDPREKWTGNQEFNVMVVLFSTDKSLCGGLNTNLFRGLESWLKSAPQDFRLPPKLKFSFVTVGKKAKEHVLKTNRFLDAEFAAFGDKPHFQDIVPVGKMVMDNFKSGTTQMAFMVYMEFVSTIAQELTVKQLLPINPGKLEAEAKVFEPEGLREGKYKGDYLFEPNPKQIFEDLLPQYVELQLYHVLLEALASEHSARMVAMKNANENALEIVDDLTLEFNRARQTKITGELLDVIGARMALE